jgi:signal transduction histidine kinase
LYNRYKLKQQTQFKTAMLEEQRLRSQGILDAEENERQRLARELHDGVGQMLCAARRQVEFSGKGQQEETLKMLDESITEVRDISHSMVPPFLLNKSLEQATEEFISRLNNKSPIVFHTNWVNTDNLELDKTTVLMLYRSIQEIIANIFRHSGATEVHLEMVNHADELSLMIYDNGIGFDKERLLQTAKGLGLKNIQSRIAYIGGSLQIDTMPSKGVTYTIELPLLIAG